MNRQLSFTNSQQPTAKTLRFRRWSRKAYATFISIQRAVTIGQLASNVSERFQVKNGVVHTSVLLAEKSSNNDTEGGDTVLQKELIQSYMLSEQLLIVSGISLFQTVRQGVEPAFIYTFNIVYIPKKRDVPVYAGTSRFSFSQNRTV